MTAALIVSNIISWFAIVALGVLVYALSRQIGVLHERIKPVGALSLGKAIQAGDTAPVFHENSLTGGMVRVGGEDIAGKSTLLFFMSSTCPVCKTLMPVLKSIGHQEKDWLKLIFASDGHEVEHMGVIREHDLRDYPYLLSDEVGMAYQISKLPYGVLIDSKGQVAAHGLINNREHVESLFEAFRATNSGEENAEQLAG
jgi:methylamine dehydrogenase accessory protein MauD